jgi:Smg protein
MIERWTQMLATLREQFTPDADIVELEQFLVSEGLDRQEIGEVLSLYFADTDEAGSGAQFPRPIGTASLRVQGPHERGRFAPDAWGYLVTLYESRVVSWFDFEQLVERALFHIDGRIGLPEIRVLADEAGLDAVAVSADRSLLH